MRSYHKTRARAFARLVKMSSGCLAFAVAWNVNAGCQYQVTNQWSNGFTAAIKITNTTSTAINGWAVNWQYASDNRISNSWNANVSGSNPYSATNLSWNASIQPSQTVEFGFQGTKGAANAEVPVLNGAPCGNVTPASSARSSTPISSAAVSSVRSSVSSLVASSVAPVSSKSSSSLVASSKSSSSSSAVSLIEASNPNIWADVPDPSVIRVGNTYYMSSTTMHMNPGVPIMKSTDLLNWTLVNYAYNTLGSTSALNLESGQNAYGKGSWASSIRYVDGIFYVSTFSYTTNKTYIYKTTNIEQGPWTVSALNGLYHDCSLFFENGRAFLAYGIDDIKIIELTADASAIKSGGLNQTIIPKSSAVAGTDFIVRPEGTHLQKINGRYYVSLITWPSGKSRTQLIYRASNLTGPYEGRVALQDQGVAQGGLIDTPTGNWYAYLFRDSGAVGRIPYLVPVSWQDGWPVMGVGGKVPQKLGFTVENKGLGGIVTSDEFNQGAQGSSVLPLQWQWNHNPDNSAWSLLARPGFMRLTNKRTASNFEVARNSLTQRTFGPQSSARIAIETAAMKDGDYAGLGALQSRYGFVGVNKSNGNKSIVMVDTTSGTPQEITRIGLFQDRVYFRIDMNFLNQTDQAKFYYSLDGNNWTVIGNTLRMTYDLKHFMGYRFALFNYATQSTGGYVDFDYYRINP
ncbi:beta-xylosidase [Cellvibrio sp. KY-GH-1]|uniref:beta-xylosidase family glycoside hydrolase n=1 Tax=Cellvibrio sp. KY-GH-1 TaxID=2303332 RepID=UPI001245EBBD|nr:cellulose binding domain-containing protein [Cellvibrio sp. KY-GH-1]QEY16486.1 beta-xylosidase [Cellvibrio sp. KY-GH-1]